MLPATVTRAGPVATAEGDTSPDGQGSAGDDGAAHAGAAGRRASPRDEPSDAVARPGTGRQASGPVAVAADRSFPAPAAHPVGPTTAGVIETLAARGNQAPATPVPQHPQAAAGAQPAHLLRIELHPAELGMVTASLRMSGEQLSIELKPETAEAYRHLADDSETIVKSLRKLGLDVDSVTVLQPSIAAQPAARVDPPAPTAGRDTPQFQPGTPGGGGDNSGGQQSGRNRGHDGQAFEKATPAHRERAQGALFI